MEENIEPKQRFTGYFIPVEIMEMEDLSWFEKILLSMVDSLYCKEHKGCFASNEYIARKLKVKENTIAKAISNLRKLKLIEDVSFDGRKRVIRSRMYGGVDKVQSNAGLDKNPSRVGQKSNPGLGKNPTPSLYSDSKGYRKEKRGGKPPSADADSPSRSDFSSKEKTIEREKNVATTKEEHQKLVERFGEEMTKEAYEVLSLWKLDTPKSKWKKSDYRSIMRWTIDAVKEKRRKEKQNATPTEYTSSEIEELKRLDRNFTFKDLCQKVGLEFGVGRYQIVFRREKKEIATILFEDPKCKEKFYHLLKKFGITWEL